MTQTTADLRERAGRVIAKLTGECDELFVYKDALVVRDLLAEIDRLRGVIETPIKEAFGRGKVWCCRHHPTHWFHEVGCPHREWTEEQLREAGYGHLIDRLRGQQGPAWLPIETLPEDLYGRILVVANGVRDLVTITHVNGKRRFWSAASRDDVTPTLWAPLMPLPAAPRT